MECRNLVTAREMEENQHWLLPTMNGEPRIEKPPLPTWLAALAYFLSPSGLALPRAISALAALLLLYYAGFSIATGLMFACTAHAFGEKRICCASRPKLPSCFWPLPSAFG